MAVLDKFGVSDNLPHAVASLPNAHPGLPTKKVIMEPTSVVFVSHPFSTLSMGSSMGGAWFRVAFGTNRPSIMSACVAWAHRSDALLTQLGVAHDYHICPMDHGISEGMHADFLTWLASLNARP